MPGWGRNTAEVFIAVNRPGIRGGS
jgi:hypothetical protein